MRARGTSNGRDMINDCFSGTYKNKRYAIIYHDDIGWVLPKPMLSYEIGCIEAAKILNIHPESVRRLARKGAIKRRKVGGKFLFEYSHIKKFADTYDPRPGNYKRDY